MLQQSFVLDLMAKPHSERGSINHQLHLHPTTLETSSKNQDGWSLCIYFYQSCVLYDCLVYKNGTRGFCSSLPPRQLFFLVGTWYLIHERMVCLLLDIVFLIFHYDNT